MSNQINLAIQVLPLGTSKDEAYRIIDVAIGYIQRSGLNYEVCPFETVVEGDYEEVMELLEDIQAGCKKAGAVELLINMKLQRSFIKGVHINEKTARYR